MMRAVDGTETQTAGPTGGRTVNRNGGFARSGAAAAVGYLVTLSAAELVTALVAPHVGLTFHAILLIALFLHTAVTHGENVQRLMLSLSLIPLMRLLSLSLPLTHFRLLHWTLVVTAPLFAATGCVMQVLNLRWRDVGLKRGSPLLQLCVALAGLPLGYAEYQILRPAPLAAALTPGDRLLASVILMICTGFGEELIFRGVIQRTAGLVLGRWEAVYAAALFAVMCAGHQSLENVFFVFGVAVVFGWVRRRTGSILGVSVAHGLTNVMLFLVMPLVEV